MALAAAYCTALVVSLIPQEISDGFGGYRVFGLVAYAGAGVLWAVFGATGWRESAGTGIHGLKGGSGTFCLVAWSPHPLHRVCMTWSPRAGIMRK